MRIIRAAVRVGALEVDAFLPRESGEVCLGEVWGLVLLGTARRGLSHRPSSTSKGSASMWNKGIIQTNASAQPLVQACGQCEREAENVHFAEAKRCF